MDILTNLQEYGVIGAAFTIVLMILKYNGKQGWKESLGLSDREKFFHLFLQTLTIATVYKGNIIKNLIMDCQSYTKYRPNETTGGIFVSWRRKEELPTGA